MTGGEKVAVVTGGASGIGLAIVECLAGSGFRVLVADVSGKESEVAAGLGAGVEAIHVDVTSPGDVKAMVEAALDGWGRLDGLVNVAGTCPNFDLIGDCPVEAYDLIMDVNLKGTFLAIKYAAPVMAAGGGGSIVNIASAGGIGGVARMGAYCAAKAGVIQLTKVAAIEYGLQDVRVNAVCPGTTLTPMAENFFTSMPGQREEVEAATALGRLGKPSDVAEVAAFLLSDAASYVTGTAVPVEGGRLASPVSRQLARVES
ncbi:SDR family NAD(P)-dependent oxidoreductase [Amycolatopsis thermophila]|uniref:NAD(P)-dependent dehydrogenase (Short-subunit alcohol dehydrogenase family) n=1 Tax=Amycolatopsis thermophila TaxID=206084 RepID=A0ABU0F5M9_9PSEU|nr:SDR family oxidoreductase [Amycolatopsis thermophila]MDQ0382813.1 NAD(P)-dependent dehydrogenase (short-subunit alcohol dehydrogenase family) [Amycolatopsis thermophila]